MFLLHKFTLSSLLFLGWFTASIASEHKSPFPSSIPGIDVPNAHLVATGAGRILRGGSPDSKVPSLAKYGVTDVVIFKNETKNEVRGEIQDWKESGVPAARIFSIPFRWDNRDGYRAKCRQTLQALDVLSRVYQTKGRMAFFHCTMGEDRTGYLSAIFRLMLEKRTPEDLFRNEMCAKGYEGADPGKPASIVAAVRANLTPLYLKMAALVSSGRISLSQLDPSVCEQEPIVSVPPAFICR